MFNNSNKTILVTGCAGFIGSNFVPYFLEKYPEYNLINLDLLTYASDLENLKEVEFNTRYKFIKGNICNRELIEFIFSEYDIKGVIHFAAESHVDNSIKNPGVFIQTNVNGTYTLVDVAYKYWMNKPFEYKEEYNNCRFHHISTDEVYGTLSEDPNDNMGIYVANQVIKLMIKRGYTIEGSRVLVLGITFKENCPDIRNSRVIDVIKELQDFGCRVDVSDCWANKEEVQHEYGLELLREPDISHYQAVVLAVAHDKYKILKFEGKNQVVFDIKGILKNADGRL